MSTTDTFKNNNLFAYLEDIGMKGDVEEACELECRHNGLPDTQGIKNAYMLYVQTLLSRVDEPVHTISVATVMQDAALNSAYRLRETGNEHMSHYGAENGVTNDMIAASILYPVFDDYDSQKDALGTAVGETPVSLADELNGLWWNKGRNFRDCSIEAQTLHLSWMIDQIEAITEQIDTSNPDKDTLSDDLSVVVLLKYQHTLGLQLEGNTQLERDLIDANKRMLRTAQSALNKPEGEVFAFPPQGGSPLDHD